MAQLSSLALAAVLLTGGVLPHAVAQNYPERAVRIVVVYAAGGSNDIVARALGQKLTQAWGQPVVIDNRPGGNTVIGTEAVAKAAPDGYTLLITPPGFTINPSLVAKLPYDALRDFAPVTLMHQSAIARRESACAGKICERVDRTGEVAAGKTQLQLLG